MSRRPPAPRGRDTGIQTGKAVVLLVVAVLVAVLVLRHVGPPAPAAVAAAHHSTTTTPTSTVPTSTTTTSTVAPIPPSQIKLLVLNGTLTGTLAHDTSKRLAASPGYNALAPDDTTAKVLTSAIYAVTPQYVAAGNALAATLGLPTSDVQSSVPAAAAIKPTERAISNLILVIGPDLASKASG